MRKTDETLSTDRRAGAGSAVKRLAGVAGVVAGISAGLFGVMFIAGPFPPEEKEAGVLLLAIPLIAGAVLLLRRIRPPELDPGAVVFRCWLPGGLSGLVVATALLLPLFCFYVLYRREFAALSDRFSGSSILYYVGACKFLVYTPLLILWLFFCRDLLARIQPLGVACDGERLVFFYPWGRRELALNKLSVQRIAHGTAGAPRALRFVSGGHVVILYASAIFPAQTHFLGQFANWLHERNTPVPEARPLVCDPAGMSAVRLVTAAAAALACGLLPWGLLLAGIFWGEWFFTGTFHAYNSFFIASAGMALGLLLLPITPLFGWTARLLGGAWLRREPAAGTPLVQVVEGFHSGEFMVTRQRRGTLAAGEDGALILTIGRAAHRIPREAILELEQTGLLKNYLAANNELMDRPFWRPVRLAWRGEEAGRPVLRRVMLGSRAGWTSGHSRQLERRLFRRLEAWQRGEEALDFSTLKNAPSWPGALAAALFVALCIGVAPLHNHLVMTKIRTGAWQSPARVPAQGAVPWPSTITALQPEGAMMLQYDRSSLSSWECILGHQIPVLGFMDFSQKWIRPLRANYDFFSGTRSFPGPLTNILIQYSSMPEEIFILPTKGLNLNGLDHQIFDLRSGRSEDIHCRMNGGTIIALYQDSRMFYTYDNWHDLQHSATSGIGWIDLKTEKYHQSGSLKHTAYPGQEYPPVFFPGGRYVLYDWRIVDLESGKIKAVTPWPKPGWLYKMPKSGIVDCSLGTHLVRRISIQKKLRKPPKQATNYGEPKPTSDFDPEDGIPLLDPNSPTTPPDKTEEIPPPPFSSASASGPVTATQSHDEFWEIDPVTGQIRVFNIPQKYLIMSVDEDRWLVTESDPTSKQSCIFSLYSPTTGRARELFREAPAGLYYLIIGRDEIMTFDASTSTWNKREIPK